MTTITMNGECVEVDVLDPKFWEEYENLLERINKKNHPWLYEHLEKEK